MKLCPYCHADSFGARELFALDYYSIDECKECKKPVRNDGLRQFLVFPTILAALAIGFFIVAITPEVLEPFAILLLIALLLFLEYFLPNRSKPN